MANRTSRYASLGEEIGRGAFGRVILAESCNEPASPVAIKLCDKNDRKGIETLRKEAYSLEAISGLVPHAIQSRDHGVLKNSEAIVLDRACSSNNPKDVLNISNVLRAKGIEGFNWWQMVSCMKQLFECIAALDDWKRVHGDLKASNLIFNFDSNLLLVVDWGASQRFDSFKNPRFGTTEISLSPEAILEKGGYDCGIDMWAAGVVLFQIYTGGDLPFPYEGKNSVFKFVLGALGKPSDDYLNSCLIKSKGVLNYCNGNHKKDWKAAIRAAAEKRKDTKGQADQIIGLLERIFCYERRISPMGALDLPLFKTDVDIKLNSEEIPKKERKQLFLSTLGLQIPLSARCVHLPATEAFEYEMAIGTTEKCLHAFKATLYPGSTLSLSKDSETFKVEIEEGCFMLNEQLKKMHLHL